MARLVDVIEMVINQMLDENDGSVIISRNTLAEKVNCVPSQITYVLSTRFTPGNGYIVESRRGGGGQITVMRAKPLSSTEYLKAMLDTIGRELSQQQARLLLQNAISRKAMNAREATIIMAACSDRALGKLDPDARSIVRADVFKNAIAGMLVDVNNNNLR